MKWLLSYFRNCYGDLTKITKRTVKIAKRKPKLPKRQQKLPKDNKVIAKFTKKTASATLERPKPSAQASAWKTKIKN